MSAQPPEPGSPPLPISGTIAEVYTLLWSNRDAFLRVVLLPAAVSFLLTAIAYYLQDGNLRRVILAVDLIPATLFAVAWHRLVLLGPEQAMTAPALRWGNRETAYLWRSILLLIGSLLAMAVPAEIAMRIAQRSVAGHLVILLVSLATLFIMVRLSLVLPASAVDARYSFAQSWNDTTAGGLRLVATVFAVGLPLLLLLQLFNLLLSVAGLIAAAPFTVMLLNSLGGYVLLAAVLTVFALAFGRLSGWRDGQSAPVPARGS